MMDFSGYLTFRVDVNFTSDIKKKIDSLLVRFPNAECNASRFDEEIISERVLVDFVSEASIHKLVPGSFKICILDRNQGLFSLVQSIDETLVDFVLDDCSSPEQLSLILFPLINNVLHERERKILAEAFKNLKKLESKIKLKVQGFYAETTFITSESLLSYTQALVDFEKELIHTEDIIKQEKILKQFTRNYIGNVKINFIFSSDLWKLPPKHNYLPMPRYKGQFLLLEIIWDDENDALFVKKFFLVHTLINFFFAQVEIEDPFTDETLWGDALDAIPFPTALITREGVICQHNALFARINLTPVECLTYGLREKVVINDIPYNVYRKEIYHLDETKFLFVLFTESIFLKGDGNVTPNGQELGIISSSIAHELNNPIAGIQAALSVLLLTKEMDEEVKQILLEMKNGANRCKQLVETFLGFSKVNPIGAMGIPLASPIEACYQQALNLLRFRTVESGIRFTLEFSKHSEFRAKVNISLMTMTFYLVLGELMTLFSHQLLIADRNQIEKVIKGEIVESSREIQIQLHELNISNLRLSKLIQNLLNIENFVLQMTEYSLRFIYTQEVIDV